MDFINFLKTDALINYPVSIYYHGDTTVSKGLYIIRSDSYKYGDSKQTNFIKFLKELEGDLLLPVSSKKMEFYFDHKDGLQAVFRNYCMQVTLDQKTPLKEFENLFHSFFKNYPMHQIFEWIYSYCGNYPRSPEIKSLATSYISYMLSQKFTETRLTVDGFLKIIDLGAFVTDDNYAEITNGLYLFFERYFSEVGFINTEAVELPMAEYLKFKRIFPPAPFTGDKGDENLRQKTTEFQQDVSLVISRIVKPEDLKKFAVFWHFIKIKDKFSDSLISPIPNSFVLSINYDFLSKANKDINNIFDADKAVLFIHKFVCGSLFNYFSMEKIQSANGSFDFVIKMKQNIKQENLTEIFNMILELMDSVSFLNSHSQSSPLSGHKKSPSAIFGIFSENNDKTDIATKLILARLQSMSLENSLPKKDDSSNFSNKTIKL